MKAATTRKPMPGASGLTTAANTGKVAALRRSWLWTNVNATESSRGRRRDVGRDKGPRPHKHSQAGADINPIEGISADDIRGAGGRIEIVRYEA